MLESLHSAPSAEGNDDYHHQNNIPQHHHYARGPDNKSILKDREGRLKNNMWFQHWIYGLNVFYYVGIMPFRFAYNEDHHRYYLHHNRFQKIVCIILQISTINVMRANLVGVLAQIRASEDPLIYFDLSFHFNLLCFGAWCKFQVFFREQSIVDLLNFMNDSKLLNVASKATPKMRLLIILYFFMYTVPSGFACYIVTSGMEQENLGWDELKKSMEDMAEAQFSFLQGSMWKTSGVHPIFMGYSFICYVIEMVTWFMSDITGIATIFTVYNVAVDLFHIMRDEAEVQMSRNQTRGTVHESFVSDMLLYIEQYRDLIKRINDVFGVNVCIYSTYCTSFYALHVVDMLASSSFPNRFLMSTQVIGGLVLSYYFSSQITILSRNINRWLSQQKRWQRINAQRVTFLLWDLTEEKFSVGSFFKITPGFVGEMYSTLITIAVVAIGFRQTQG